MTETKTNPILRLLPSLTDVAFLLPLLFLFAGLNGARTMLGDGDTGWHVRAGEWMLAHGQVPRQDLFSYTRPEAPWYAWEWLWDVAFAWLHVRWGMADVVLASLLVVCVTFALLYRLVYRRCGNPLVAIALTGLAGAGASIHWLARPHLFTTLFLVIFLSILERVREGRTRLLWTLPVLTVPWTNLHGGFFVGILVLGIYGLGEVLAALLAGQGEEKAPRLRRAGAYFAAAAGCALASLANPYGYHLHAHIFTYLRDPYLVKYIQEFQSTNFQWAQTTFLEVMLIFGICAAMWYGKRKQYGEVLMIAAWGHLSLMMGRNIPLYMLAAAPVAAQPIASWLRAAAHAPVAEWLRKGLGMFHEIAEEIHPLDKPWRLHAISALAMLAVALGLSSPVAGKKFQTNYDPAGYPEKALALLGQPGQRVFSDDEWGDYLIYKLSPRGAKVFVDGRSDFYGAKFNQAYVDALNVKYTWPQTLEQYGVNTLLLRAADPLAGAVKESSRWRAVYDDGLAIVFQKTGGAAGQLLPAGSAGPQPQAIAVFGDSSRERSNQ